MDGVRGSAGIDVFIHALPEKMLSSNAGSRSRRDPWSISTAKMLLKGETIAALQQNCELPKFQRVTADVTLIHSGKRPKAVDCPRCKPRMGDGTYPGYAIPKDRAKPLPCVCYRPMDVGNIGGEPLKPILDALTYLDILVDDSAEYLAAVTLRIQRCTTLDQEGIRLVVQEVQETDTEGPSLGL